MIDAGPRRVETRRLWRDDARATLALSWPLILTNLAQSAPTTTDVLMLGRLGADKLAAGALGTNLYFAMLIFGIGVVNAVSPLAAAELGARRHDVREVRRIVRHGLWAALLLSVPVWIVLWHTEPILVALGQEPQLAADAALYMRALQWAYFPFLGYIVLRSYIAALERPLWGLWAGVAGTIVNVVLAWGLIFGALGMPRLGLAGAGIATTVACAVMFGVLAAVVSLDRRFRRYHLFGRFWRPDWGRFAQLMRVGLPLGATLAFEVTIFNAAVLLMGLIGATAVAAHSIAIQIASVAFMVPLGFGQAAAVRVGLGYGARDPRAIRRAGWMAYAMGVGFMVVTASLMLFAGRPLVGLFLDPADPANAEVIALAVLFLVFAAIFQLADGAQAVASGMLRGLQDTRVPMLFAALGYWGIGLPLSAGLAFPAGFGGAGIWAGLAVGLAVVAVLMTTRWAMRDRLGLTERVESAGEPA